MNSILQLKGRFEQRRGKPGGGKRNLPVDGHVEYVNLPLRISHRGYNR